MPQAPQGNSDPENPNATNLYVGNLDIRTSEQMLFEIFSAVTTVKSCKIINEKNFTTNAVCYGFVEFPDHESAETAMKKMNGRKIFDYEIRVNWASLKNNQNRDNQASQFHIFIGDLCPEVNESSLLEALSEFTSISNTKIMIDPNTRLSRGFAFLTLTDKEQADNLIASMNGKTIGSRQIRVNWANQNTFHGNRSNQSGNHQNKYNSSKYEITLKQSAPFNTIVYCGNLTSFTTHDNLLRIFSQYGYVNDIRIQSNNGFAFVKMDTHENAAMAIVSVNGIVLNGKNIRCSWGKDSYAEKTMNNHLQNKNRYQNRR
ncbi:hypothetical protein BB558_003317 [Smittium angustum]|nr:hypothetical protein BB558_003317 [Smittium angustum]